jgi:Ca-activated chloride channel family protein
MRLVFGLIPLALCLWAPVILSQSTAASNAADSARLEGAITGPSGAPVPSAALSLKRLPSGPVITRRTGPDGRYLFAEIPAGEYELSVAASGFKTIVQRITLARSQRKALNLTLAAGEVNESISVAAPASKTHTAMAGVAGGVIGGIYRGAPPGFHTEEYGVLNEDGFTSVQHSPLSTFSADVDTAAYTNIRRFLRDGKMPPKDAVRIEEMLNFFTYDYPMPPPGRPFSATLELAACPWAKDHQVVHIGLRTAPVSAENLPPARLTFLLDVSGSMMPPNKLPLLKRSLSLLAEQLRPQDKVAIVVYAGAAGLVLEPTSGSEKTRILEALERLQAGGSTAGAAGIRLAYETARSMYQPGALNRVILATDGDFNVGVSSDGELKTLIEKARDSGVFLTVLGFGYGNLKDAKLETLAQNGNGNYAYIDSLLEARRALVEQMGATLLTVAKDVKLQVEFNPAHVKAYRLIGYENRRLRAEDFKDDRKDAGDLGAGHSVTALYEIIPASSSETAPGVDQLKYQNTRPTPQAAKSGELLTLKLRYKDPEAAQSRELVEVLKAGSRQPSLSFRFALAVAEFGLLLRDSEFKGSATYDNVAALAESALGDDEDGNRAEFLALVKQVRRSLRLRSSR